MIKIQTTTFLKQLKDNNTKEWMDGHRKEYESAKQNFEDFVAALLEGMTALEPTFSDLRAKQCVFRMNRDIRFSKNKSPYKTNFGAALSRGGKKSPYADYYFHLEPGASFIAGGAWMPSPEWLKGIRQEIDYDLKGFQKIINRAEFKKIFPQVDGERLKTAPQGYSVDNPAIEYLRHKSFTVSHSIADKAIAGKELVKQTLHSFATMKPFLDFLNQSIE